MVKPASAVPKNKWMVNKVSEDQVPKTVPLRRTQKRRLQRAKSIQKMKNTL